MEAYALKSRNALKAMHASSDNPEWEISAAYYAMYFSVYSLFMKCGIKSEIHSCTIEIFRRFFKNHFSEDDISWLFTAKKLREVAQYYVFSLEKLKGYPEVLRIAPDFCSKCILVTDALDVMLIRRNLCSSISGSFP